MCDEVRNAVAHRPSKLYGWRVGLDYPVTWTTKQKLQSIGKGKAVPLQPWSGPEGSRKLRFPDYMTTAQDDGKVVSLMHRPPLPPGNAPGTHFC
jgi:hypothetical protein